MAPVTRTAPAPVTITTPRTSGGAVPNPPKSSGAMTSPTNRITGAAIRNAVPGPRPVLGRVRRTQPSGEATTRRSASVLTSAPSRGTATAITAKPAQTVTGGCCHSTSRSSAEKTVATAEPTRHVSPASSAAIRRTWAGEAPARRSPASRLSRCTAPMRAHCPRKPSTGTSRRSSVRTMPERSPGRSSRPLPMDRWCCPRSEATATAARPKPVASPAPTAVSVIRHHSRRSEPRVSSSASLRSVLTGTPPWTRRPPSRPRGRLPRPRPAARPPDPRTPPPARHV